MKLNEVSDHIVIVFCLTSQVSHDRGWRGVCVCTIRDSHGRCAVAPGWAVFSFFWIPITLGLRKAHQNFLCHHLVNSFAIGCALEIKPVVCLFWWVRTKAQPRINMVRLHFFRRDMHARMQDDARRQARANFNDKTATPPTELESQYIELRFVCPPKVREASTETALL